MRRTNQQLQESLGPVARFVRARRKDAGLTQEELAGQCGVGLRFLKELELGKETLRMDKVQQVLQYFGHHLEPSPLPLDER